MSEQEAVRRLVKSGPELWAQCSDPLLLSKHLAVFGEITITRLEPESAVAWEGESGSGTVSLETTGWGTRVRLTAAAPPPAATRPADPVILELELEPEVVRRPRRLGSLLHALLYRRREVSMAPMIPEPEFESDPAVDSESLNLVAELEAALDSLGAAHHRPYSRS
jgi:hypothetical protein